MVRELIASVKAKPDSPFIFTTTGTTPVSGWSRMKDRLDAAMLAAAREEGHAVIQPWTQNLEAIGHDKVRDCFARSDAV